MKSSWASFPLVIFGLFSASAVSFGETKQAPPVKIGNQTLNFIDATPYSERGNTTEIIKSKINQLYFQDREDQLVEYFYLYSNNIKFNHELHRWANRSWKSYRGLREVDETLPLAMEWAGEWKASHLVFRWFSTGEGVVSDQVLEDTVAAVESFEFYHVGEPDDIVPNSPLVEQIARLEKKHPNKVKSIRVSREVKIQFTE